ncbi:MAG TPA: CHAT domain-containing protein, partial [Polyangium sp.]|nr:CHAT domain-containing protein [Polyangium sp.]
DRDGISQLGPLEAHQQSKIIEMPCPPIRGVRATTENILGALREAAMTQPAIIHVVGGTRAIDDGNMALGLRSLDGDVVYAEIAPFANELQASFHDKPVAMVVLNVCAGARAGTTHGIAEALLRAGVQAVVAYTRWPSPKVTATVTEALYENLFKHHQTQGNIAAAVSAVRRRLDTQVLTDSTGRRESTSLVVYLAGRDPILFAAATNFVNGRTPLPSHNNEPTTTSTVRAQSAPMYQVVHTQSQPTVWPQQTQTVIIQQPLPPPPPPNAANYVAAAGILGILAALGAGTVWVLQETLHAARLDEGASCEYAWQCNEGLTCSSGKCAKLDNGSVGSRTLEAPALGPPSLQAPLPQQNDPFRLKPPTVVSPNLLLTTENLKPCPRSTNDDKPVRTFDTSPPNSPTGSGSSRRPCDPPAAWDGRPRGWAREGPHCLCAETKTGYYLRVDEQNCQRLSESFIESSKSAIANRWGRYEETYLRNGEDCPKGEVIFIARTFCGVGILFPEKPPHWDELVHKEHGWMLRDQGSRPITEPRCFFPVSDQTYQDPSTAAPSLQNLEP